MIPENIFLADLKKSPYIYQVGISPTNSCNSNCSWCSTQIARISRSRIDLLPLRNYLESFIHSGGKSVVFSGGGEPLLFNPIYQKTNEFDKKTIIEYLSFNNIFIGLITNGYLLENLLKNTSDLNNFMFIRISLNACNELEYSRNHNVNKSLFNVVYKNIDRLIKFRGKSFIPAIGLSFVVDFQSNINSLESSIKSICDLSKNTGVDFVQFKHLITNNEINANTEMDIIHRYCLNCDWGDTEFWVQKYQSMHNFKCLITQYVQELGGENEKYPCCHRFGQSNFYHGTPFIPKGEVYDDCSNISCRFYSVNNLLHQTDKITSLDKLHKSINKFGFHPYRLTTTFPSIYHPFSNTKRPDYEA